jgi:ATP-binding cassette subfamily B protein
MSTKPAKQTSALAGVRKLLPHLKEERGSLVLTALTILLASGINLAVPFIFGNAIDTFVRTGNYPGIFATTAGLFVAFLIALGTSYWQMQLTGRIGQRMLFRLRNMIFAKLQSLPVAFFNQNKAGDLISRINNDTDKLNQFFSETLVRFMMSIVMIVGSGIFLIVIDWRLGLAALVPAVALFIFTRATSGWIKKRNAESLRATGGLSAEIQESLEHFKVVVAFDRRDYFRKRFADANAINFKAAVRAGISSALYSPFYDLCANIATLIVLGYGVFLITQGNLTLGLLLSFLIYIDRFYGPLRQIAMLWTSFQLALAAWDRVSEIMEETMNLPTIDNATSESKKSFVRFQNVAFGYPERPNVLHDINIELERGKTYALVGPTGGGKTTTASLMARLYDPSNGSITLDGRDLRSYSDEERTNKIGFILQEPFLFTGTVLDNLFYANPKFASIDRDSRIKIVNQMGLENLLARFERGVDTPISGTDSISLGQKQLIAFMRAVLRKPELLILDEATANIDTVTEQLLQDALDKLPKSTTKVIIAHRLNTIENADEIFFVNDGRLTAAGSLDKAVDMLMHGKRTS